MSCKVAFLLNQAITYMVVLILQSIIRSGGSGDMQTMAGHLLFHSIWTPGDLDMWLDSSYIEGIVLHSQATQHPTPNTSVTEPIIAL